MLNLFGTVALASLPACGPSLIERPGGGAVKDLQPIGDAGWTNRCYGGGLFLSAEEIHHWYKYGDTEQN